MKITLVIKKYVPYILLSLIILLHFYLYRGEFKVLTDPNDNIFHAALIDDSKNIWKDVFAGKLSPMYLIDSWNERWAEGFSLSFYYSHLPEAAISLLSFIIPISTFKLFVIIRTLLLILLPVSFFVGAMILGFSTTFAIIFAFLSQALFTDGLYGLDSPSFLWRGWGLFSQLIAVAILPIAFAYGIRYLKDNKNLGMAIFFNFLLAQAHFGMFYLLLFSYPVFWIFSLDRWLVVGKRTLKFILLTIIALSYFVIPFFITGQYRNYSYWDPIWKFDSWGLLHIIKLLTNGDLFDFNRFPFLTIFMISGILAGLIQKNKIRLYLIAMTGIYFVLFLGKDVLGPLINIMPGLSEFHLHRVIVMFQFMSLLVASEWLLDLFLFVKKKKILLLIIIVLGLVSIYYIEKPIIKYAKENDDWLINSNLDYQKHINDYKKITDVLYQLPSARIYAGRPGNWGRNFKVGDTQIYMALSQSGFPTVGFLPQSWSPNSDSEQFFSEDSQIYYNIYNVGYLLLPADKKPPKFARLIMKQGKFALFKIDTDGWFDIGHSNLEVISNKTDLLNITHQWMTSSQLSNKEFPVISFSDKELTFVSKIIKMNDLNAYQNVKDQNDSVKSIWSNNLFSMTKESNIKLTNQIEEKVTQGYKVNFKMDQNCSNCVLILKQTFHPNWQIRVNGKKVKSFPVLPFFVGIQINDPGNYEISAIYKPSFLKIILLILSVVFFMFGFKKILKKV